MPPTETTIYRITNVTLRYVRQMDDGDYHLVIADANGGTMIVESPDPSCAASSAFATQINKVRTKIDTAIQNVSSTPVQPNTVVSLKGVGFFDALNRAYGQALNGIELHPLTGICFGPDCKP